MTASISKLQETLKSHINYKVAFGVILPMTNSKGESFQRTVYAYDYNDSFLETSSDLMLILCVSDGSFDLYPRLDELERALNKLVSNPDSNLEPELASILAVRNAMLPLEIDSNLLIGDNAETILEALDIESYTHRFGKSDINSTELNVSIDISKDNVRSGIRVYASGIDEIKIDNENKFITVMLKHGVENFNAIERVNKIELMIDKLSSTITKNGKFNKSALKQAAKLLEAKL